MTDPDYQRSSPHEPMGAGYGGMIGDARAMMREARELMDEAKALLPRGKALLDRVESSWWLKLLEKFKLW